MKVHNPVAHMWVAWVSIAAMMDLKRIFAKKKNVAREAKSFGERDLRLHLIASLSKEEGMDLLAARTAYLVQQAVKGVCTIATIKQDENFIVDLTTQQCHLEKEYIKGKYLEIIMVFQDPKFAPAIHGILGLPCTLVPLSTTDPMGNWLTGHQWVMAGQIPNILGVPPIFQDLKAYPLNNYTLAMEPGLSHIATRRLL
jgi:hypothetical protein